MQISVKVPRTIFVVVYPGPHFARMLHTQSHKVKIIPSHGVRSLITYVRKVGLAVAQEV